MDLVTTLATDAPTWGLSDWILAAGIGGAWALAVSRAVRRKLVGRFGAAAMTAAVVWVCSVGFSAAREQVTATFTGETVATYVHDTYGLVPLREAAVNLDMHTVSFDASDLGGRPVRVTVTWTTADVLVAGTTVPGGYDPVVVQVDDGATVTTHNAGHSTTSPTAPTTEAAPSQSRAPLLKELP